MRWWLPRLPFVGGESEIKNINKYMIFFVYKGEHFVFLDRKGEYFVSLKKKLKITIFKWIEGGGGSVGW